MKTKWTVHLATFSIGWLLLFAGILELWGIPEYAIDLQSRYIEYRGQALTIGLLLEALVILGQGALILIALLLHRIKNRSLLNSDGMGLAHKLSYVLGLLGIAFLVLFFWLLTRNTMPPFVAITLWTGSLLAFTAALATKALVNVLQDSINNRDDLEGVI